MNVPIIVPVHAVTVPYVIYPLLFQLQSIDAEEASHGTRNEVK